MKKMLSVLVVLIFCGSVFGGTVTLRLNQDANDYAARRVELYYSSADDISGFGLKITADGGAVITSVTADHKGESTSGDKGFGVFPESFSTYLDASAPDWGDANYTPVAPNSAPGAAGTGIGYPSVVLEMGALYEDGNQPNLAGRLCTFTVSADCNVSVTTDSARGNVILADGTEATVVGDTILVVWGPHPYPLCWDDPTQCHGDVDDDGTVGLPDFYKFRDGWGCCYPEQCYIDNACADTNRDGCIGLPDFYQFRDHWGWVVVPVDCPPGDYNGIFCP